MLDTNILTNLLDVFIRVFSLGFANILPDARHLLGILAALEVCFAGLLWALDGGQKLEVEFLKKVLLIGFFIWVVTEYQSLVEIVLSGFVYVGETASGRETSFLTDPSHIVTLGFRAAQPIFNRVSDYNKFALWKIPEMLLIAFTGLLIILSYFAIAITAFITYVEFYMVAVLGLILIPFGVFKHTSFLTEKVFGAIIAFGIRLMVLAFILGVVEPVLTPFTLPPDPSYEQIFTLLLAAFSVAVLSWHAPGIASGLMAGAPSLGAGSMLGTGLAIGAGTALAGGAAVGAARGIAHGGYAATKAASQAISHHQGGAAGKGASGNAGAGSSGTGGAGGGGINTGSGLGAGGGSIGGAGAGGGGRGAGGGESGNSEGEGDKGKPVVTPPGPSRGRPPWAETFLIARNAIPQDSTPGPGMSAPVRHD